MAEHRRLSDLSCAKVIKVVIGAALVSQSAISQPAPALRHWAAGKKYALVVGIERYADSKIPGAMFADRDGTGLADVLRTKLKAAYDEVVVLTNEQATRSPIVRALERLSDECGPRDTLLVFFACHGIPKKDEVYLAPHDMTTFLTEKGISIQDVVRRYLEKSQAGMKLLLLDTCYSGVAVDVDEQGRVKWGRGEQRGFAGVTEKLVERDEALGIITAASNDQASWGDPASKHGFFTKHLLRALEGIADKPPFGNYDGYITADEAYAYVCDRVRSEVKRRHGAEQRPMRLFRGAQLLLANVEPGRYTLDLRSEPAKAQVLIDHTPKGNTPFSTQLLIGREYRVTIAKKGFGDWDYRLLGRSEEPVRKLARLRPAGQRDTRLKIALDYLKRGQRAVAEPLLKDLARSDSADALAALVELCKDALSQQDLATARKWADDLRTRFPQSAQSVEADRAIYEHYVGSAGDVKTIETVRARAAAQERFCRLNPGNTCVSDAERETKRLREQQADLYTTKTARLAKVARDFLEISDFASARKACKQIDGLHSDAKRLDSLSLDSATLTRLRTEIDSRERQVAEDRSFGAAQKAALEAERQQDPAAAITAYQDLLSREPQNRHAERARRELARLNDAKQALEAAARRMREDKAFEQTQSRAAAAEQKHDYAVAIAAYERLLRQTPPARHEQKARTELARLRDAKATFEARQYEIAMGKAREAAVRQDTVTVAAQCEVALRYRPNDPAALRLFEGVKPFLMVTSSRTSARGHDAEARAAGSHRVPRGEDLNVDVYINDQSVGTTPLRWSNIEMGQLCRVEVRLRGLFAEPQSLRIEKFGSIPLHFEMEESRLPAGFDKAFVLPTAEKDQHGNPVVLRSGNRTDPETGWPDEIWLQQEVKSGVLLWRKTARLTMEFVLVSPGEFMMGSSISADEVARRHGGEVRDFTDAHPQHRVRVTKPFYMGKYEITNGQYRHFKSNHDSRGYYGKSLDGAQRPVAYVSWNDATAFCKWLGSRIGVEARLPTEAQWEYACRAGSQTPYYWGEKLDPGYCNFADTSTSFDRRESKLDDGYAMTAPVGRFKPNAFGMYDMLGNVWEWCQDGQREYGSSTAVDPVGPEGDSRVFRGGSWYCAPSYVRSAYRTSTGPFSGPTFIGFRVVLCVPSE